MLVATSKTMSGSSSFVGVALFISSVTFIFKRKWTAAALYRAPLKMGPESIIKRLKLLEIPIPTGERHNLMRIQNEILINQFVEEGEGVKYVINVTNDDEKIVKPQSALDYVADLYSVGWNEALLKKRHDLDLTVINDNLGAVFHPSRFLSAEFTQDHMQLVTHNIAKWQQDYTSQIIPTSSVKGYEAFQKGITENTIRFIGFPSLSPTYSLKPLRYEFVALGGTFDHLHNGHKTLLSVGSALCSTQMTIGITATSMLTKKSNADLIEDFQTRSQNVRTFLHTFRGDDMAIDIHELNDGMGPAVVDTRLQAIVVSSETILGAFKINEVRKERKMNALEVIVISRKDPVVLSSSFLRMQEKAFT